MTQLVLCKIGAKVGTAGDGKPGFPIFKYNEKRWRALDFLQDDHQLESLLEAVHSFNSTKLKISLAEIDDDEGGTLLAVVYKRVADFWHAMVPTIHHIFSMVFKNFVEYLHVNVAAVVEASDSIQTANESAEGAKEQHLVLDYVTTALYDALYQKHRSSAVSAATTEPLSMPARFLPTLCRYQERTVQWLLRRERQVERFPAYYTRLEAKDNCTVMYKHNFSAHLRLDAPPPIELGPGGILADEMGLGKTVEMLALMILNPRPHCSLSLPLPQIPPQIPPTKRLRRERILFCICAERSTDTELMQCTQCFLWQHAACVSKYDDEDTDDDSVAYLCPSCWHLRTQTAPLKAPTTFIVLPSAIKTQWLAEIERHINPTLSVFDYKESMLASWISPLQLAKYDIVVSEYTVLRREIYYTKEYVSDRKTRNPHRSMRRLTPLRMVEWWRICVDEAQLTESNTSKVAALVQTLPAVNRWAVTGTPIHRTIDDLRSLLQLIGFIDACEPLHAWQSLVRDFVVQYEQSAEQSALVAVLQKCMWRTCKSQIVDELQIPPQMQQVHRLHLSNLEQLFYMERHGLCAKSFNRMANKYLEGVNGIVKISPHVLKLILQPLLEIRQCCSIPVVSAGKRNKSSTAAVQQKQFLQPKELHAHLKSANEIECKIELRSVASSYNGMAALYFMRKNYDEAIRYYELVLRLARDYQDMKITVDTLLQIHALHNILQAYYTAPQHAKNLPQAKVAKYEKDRDALEWKYLESYAKQLDSARSAYLSTKRNVENLESCDDALRELLSALIDQIYDEEKQFSEALMHKILDESISLFAGNDKLQNLHSVRGMLYVVETWYRKVEIALRRLHAEFEALRFYTDNVRARNQVQPAIWREMTQFKLSVYECHLSEIMDDGAQKAKANNEMSKKKQTSLCKLCEIRDVLNSFECLLFNKIVDEEANATEGKEFPSMEVSLIKILFSFLRTKPIFFRFVEEMNKCWEMIECIQTLCKKLIKYWIEIEYTVKAYDELDMCKMRISLTADKEEKSHYKLLECEVDAALRHQEFNLETAKRQFAQKWARLKYIMHLEADADSGPCPICHAEDSTRYAVLECGHNICLLCLGNIRKNYVYQKLCCPICRNQQSSEKIYYVTRTVAPPQEELIEVVGDYTSKILYIVRVILMLKRDHRNEEEPLKILIFSQWTEILKPIAAALRENGIRYRIKWSPRIIDDFKNPELGVTCLLMPLFKGCNGLNLIEATHVFLVEPILNPGEEAQAIGRVHRFGQTKVTTVHRFIVSNTIEENIFNVVSAGVQSQGHWDFKNMSVDSLRNLFHLKNNVNEENDV